jgi:ribose transport system permease protein
MITDTHSPLSAAAEAPPTTRRGRFERFRALGILASFILVFAVFSVASSDFLTQANLTQVALQSSINAILAIGMTLVIVTAGIDLSVGSMAGLGSIIATVVMTSTGNPALGILVGLGMGALGGAINGVLVGWLRLGAFIVTLGTLSLYRGASLVATNGTPVYGVPLSFRTIVAGQIGPIPAPLIIVVVVGVLAHFLLRYTTFGESIIAVGGNQEAARLCGIPVERTKAIVYVISGVLAALGGLILVGRVGAADPTGGTGYELDAIAAAVIGGASLAGGSGRIGGTILGALILGALRNGLTLLDVPSFYQQVASGLVIIVAIVIDRYISREPA